MITGDYPSTARAIARDAGIDIGAAAPCPAAELARSTTPRCATAHARLGNVFARIQPEQKLRLVEALKHATKWWR